MRIVHWTLDNGSGLNRIATNLAIQEAADGLDSAVCYTAPAAGSAPAPMSTVRVLTAEQAVDADIHVVHAHCPDIITGKKIFVAHGTPEHCFSMAMTEGLSKGYAAADAFMMTLTRINNTDATVTFWDRHADLYHTMYRNANIHVIPLGIDTDFWRPLSSQGKWIGSPSLLSCENSHQIKWPLDIILAYPFIMEIVREVVLHLHYLPLDQHRWWYPLLIANGTAYRAYTSGNFFDSATLRNAFCSVDYYLSPVRYGDQNCISMEAAACGCKVISYRGNPYADYWIDEGDQRIMAMQIVDIITGKTEARADKKPVPTLREMTDAMRQIYEEVSCQKKT